MTTNSPLQLLLQQLRMFGLNPHEWLVIGRNDAASFMLCHRQDPDFKLNGSMTQDASGFWRVGSLALASL